MLSEWPRGYSYLTVVIVVICLMEAERSIESREMYSPDKQGEYMPEEGVACFSLLGQTNMPMEIGHEVTEVQTPSGKYAMQLKVMMADCPGCPCPPTFSWNAGMVMHVLKSNPTLRDLEHVQVDGYGLAYLFFYNKQGWCGLSQEAD